MPHRAIADERTVKCPSVQSGRDMQQSEKEHRAFRNEPEDAAAPSTTNQTAPQPQQQKTHSPAGAFLVELIKRETAQRVARSVAM